MTPRLTIPGAVDVVIRCALEHLGERVMVPAQRGHRTLEVGACVRILGDGEPRSEFATPDELRGCWSEPLREGTLILFLLLRCPDARGSTAAGLFQEAVGCVWPDPDAGNGVELPGGYQGWVGPLPGERLRPLAA